MMRAMLSALALSMPVSGARVERVLHITGTIQPSLAMSAWRDGEFIVVEATRWHTYDPGHWREAYYAPRGEPVQLALTDAGIVAANVSRKIEYARVSNFLRRSFP